MKNLAGLSTLNIELTNVCNKNCWMCGRRKIEKEKPEFYSTYSKHISFDLLEKIAKELKNQKLLIQFHWDGEPLLHPKLKEALLLFKNQIKCLDTNGKELYNKADQIIGILDTLTLSTFVNDSEWEEQYEILLKFLKLKGDDKPNVIIRQLGDIEEHRLTLYEKTGCLMAKRILHSPMGSFNYTQKTVIPEYGICLEMLSHPAIDVNGNMSICVRFDPEKLGVIGNINDSTITELWNSDKRKEWLQYHINGEREKHLLCKNCDFWGIPKG